MALKRGLSDWAIVMGSFQWRRGLLRSSALCVCNSHGIGELFFSSILSVVFSILPFVSFFFLLSSLYEMARYGCNNADWDVMPHIKTSLTFKCLIEHLLADFSYSRPLDTYLWKQMMKMNRNITYKWCNIDKKHLLFTISVWYPI